jgi:outer membrane protein assembly factor BamB
MNTSFFNRFLPIVAAGIGIVLIAVWWFPRRPLPERVPGTDLADASSGTNAVRLEGKLIKSNGVPSEITGSWPRFRGPGLDGISPDKTPLSKAWPKDGPGKLWTIDVGEGFAGAAIFKGRAYLMDYDRDRQCDAIRCLSMNDGAELWRFTYPSKVKRNHGMSRTIPAITDKYLIGLGPKCVVTCLDPLTGEFKWMLDLVKEFGVEVPPWYAGQCPLIEDGKLILGTGGDALVVAVDCETGKTLWKSPNPINWQMTHSSITPVDFEGQRIYVYCASGGVAGIAAKDGALLWQTPEWKISFANVPSPVSIGDGRLFFCGGYNAGAMMLKMIKKDNRIDVEIGFRLKATVFSSEQQTPILYKDHLFGVRQSDKQLVCLNLEGKPVWTSGVSQRFGSGPYLIAQDMIYVLDDNGMLTLADASVTGYKQLAQAKVLEGPDAWGPMALAGGRLVIRDVYKMACLDISQK